MLAADQKETASLKVWKITAFFFYLQILSGRPVLWNKIRPRICCCNPQMLWKSPGYEKVCSLSPRCQYHNQYWPTIPYAQSGPLTITVTTDHLLASNLWSGQRKKVLIHSFCLCAKKHNVIFTISLTGNCGHSAYAKVLGHLIVPLSPSASLCCHVGA